MSDDTGITASQLATIIMAQIAAASAVIFAVLTSTESNGAAVHCILSELSEHRANSYDADRDAAVAEGRPFNVPRPAPAVLSAGSRPCADFMGGQR